MASTGHLLDEPIPTQQGTRDTNQAATPDDDVPPSYETSKPPSFRASSFAKDGKKHLLLAACGSIATTKLPKIIKSLESSTDITIRVILTEAATRFLSGRSAETPSIESVRGLPHVEGIYLDADEYSEPWVPGTPILHKELRSWADIMLVAPLDASTLAKLANGLSDNLLTSVLRAWDPEGKLNPSPRSGRPKFLLVAPAMDAVMWTHPATEKHITVLEEDWAAARRFWKGPGYVPGPGMSDHTISVRPWAKVLRPRPATTVDEKRKGKENTSDGDANGNEEGADVMMSVGHLVVDILYQVGKFNIYES